LETANNVLLFIFCILGASAALPRRALSQIFLLRTRAARARHYGKTWV